MIYPTHEQYDKIAEELMYLCETNDNAVRMVLDELGFDEELVNSQIFNDELETRVFLCEHCDLWLDATTRIHNEIAAATICEECDERYSN